MVSNWLTARWLRPILACFAFAGLAFLGGCGGGSGAPNNPFAPPPPTPAPVAILPATSTVYSNTPATLTISGGVSPFFVTSSNSAILPVAQTNTTGTIVLLAANVVSDTVVLIQVTDSIGQTATASATVKAAPIFNTLTVTPSSSACGVNSICSGQTATASVTVTAPGGAGIPNRQVRFDVVAGAYSIKSSDPANPFVPTLTVVSDQFGVAKVILQAAAGVPTQPALLRATELTSGNQQTAQFTIVQTINGSAVLSVVPTDITFHGPDTSACSNNFRGDYFIFGGTPPYQVFVTPPGGVALANVPVLFSGGFFTAITSSAVCVDPATLLIVDASGLTTTATLHNLVGTTPPPAPPPPTSNVSITPNTVTASSTGGTCPGPFTFVVQSGLPPYNVVAVAPTGQPAATVSPSVVTTSPGTVDISGIGSGITSGSVKYTITVGDSSTPQTFDNATITCNFGT